MDSTPARLPKKSSNNLSGSSPLPLGPAVALPSIPTDNESSKNKEKIEAQKNLIVLTVMFRCLLNETYSPEIRALVRIQTAKICEEQKLMSRAEAKLIAQNIMDNAKRAAHPMDSMF